MEGWRDGREDGANKQLFCSCKQAIQGTSPGGTELFQGCVLLRELPLRVCLCARLSARSPLGLNIQSGWSPSPHRIKKSANPVCVYVCVCVLTRPSARGSSLPGQMEGQQLLAKNVLCVHFAWRVSGVQTCEKTEMHDSVIVLCKMDDSWIENATLWMQACFVILHNTNTCHQKVAGIQAV